MSSMSTQVEQPGPINHKHDAEEVCLDCDPPISQHKSSVTLNIDLVSPSDLPGTSTAAVVGNESGQLRSQPAQHVATTLGPEHIEPPSESGAKPKILIQFCDRCRW